MSTKKEKCNSNSSNSIQLFYYEGLSVHTINIEGEIWFVAKDICTILGFENQRDAISKLDDDERMSFTVSNSTESEKATRPNGRCVTFNIISESGVNFLISRSNKPDAKAFSRWVHHEVLPSIRKTRSYSFNDMNHNDEVTVQRRLLMRQEKEAIRIRKTFWEKMLRAVEAIDNVWHSNEVVPVTGIPKGLEIDSACVKLTDKISRALKECVKEKLRSLEAEEHAVSVLANR